MYESEGKLTAKVIKLNKESLGQSIVDLPPPCPHFSNKYMAVTPCQTTPLRADALYGLPLFRNSCEIAWIRLDPLS